MQIMRRGFSFLGKVENIIAKADQEAGSWDDKFDLKDNDGNFCTIKYTSLTSRCKRKLCIVNDACSALGAVISDINCGGFYYAQHEESLYTPRNMVSRLENQVWQNRNLLSYANKYVLNKGNNISCEHSKASIDLKNTSKAIQKFLDKVDYLFKYMSDAKLNLKEESAKIDKIKEEEIIESKEIKVQDTFSSETTQKTNSSYCNTFTKIAIAVGIVSFVALQALK